MELVAPIIDISIRLCDCVGKDMRSIWNFEANIRSLEVELDQLKNVSEDVKRRVEFEEERHATRTKQVEIWLRDVENCETSVNEVLLKAHQEGQRRFWCSICPTNYWSCYKLCKEVNKKLEIVCKVKNQGSFDNVTVMLPHGRVDERPLEETVGLNMAFEQVREWIEDEKVNTIGVFGMGGVGKTTLLKMINNEFVKTDYGFDRFIWIVVSKQSTVERVQDAVCEKLKLPENTWKNKSEDEKSVQIFRILHGKKFVLMLDDVWKRVDLVKVGIPPPDDQIMCNVIFTTRYEDVCGQMGADKKIKIECLSTEEALILFKKRVGVSTVNSHPVISRLAEVVAEACKGLPLALITVGRAMAGKTNPHDWDRAITRLSKDPYRILGMDTDVYHVLKFSYDSLHDEATKSCFIYFCIFPEDYEIIIDELLDLWIGEGIFDEFDDTRDARDQGWEIVRALKDACLLEDGKSEEYVKMHDVIRDMALWISNGYSGNTNANKYLVLDHIKLIEVQSTTSWMKAERISLWGSSITSVAEIPPCPNVVTFLVRNTSIRIFPFGFLQSMHVIKVLDLSFNFHLAELPLGIDKLVELQFLNLSNTRIEELPMEIKNLTKMRHLLLNATYRLEMIPQQVISSFLLLRVFRISGSNYSSSSNNINLLDELECLQHINDISITLFDATSLKKLQCSYKIQGCLTSLCFERCADLTLLGLTSSSVKRMRHLEKLDLYYCVLQELVIFPEPHEDNNIYFHNLRKINVAYCDNLMDLTWLIYAPLLEILDVSHCASMVEIVKGPPSHTTGTEADMNVFPRLKKLRLLNLPSLCSIYPRPLPMPSLIEIHVGACRSLRRLPFDSIITANTLKEIRGSKFWWNMLKWDDETVLRRFSLYFVPEEPNW